MRPDDPMDRNLVVPIDGSLALDPELEALSAELDAASARIRVARAMDRTERPSVAFEADLRARLQHYLQQHHPHLLSVYDVDQLRGMIEERLANPVDARVGMEAHRSF